MGSSQSISSAMDSTSKSKETPNSAESPNTLFSIPSEPLQPKRTNRSSPFTRSQCLGGKYCVAGCLLHKPRRRRNTSNSQLQASTPVALATNSETPYSPSLSLNAFSDDDGLFDEEPPYQPEVSTVKIVRNFFRTHIRRLHTSSQNNSTEDYIQNDNNFDSEDIDLNNHHSHRHHDYHQNHHDRDESRMAAANIRKKRKQKIVPQNESKLSLLILIFAFLGIFIAAYVSYVSFSNTNSSSHSLPYYSSSSSSLSSSPPSLSLPSSHLNANLTSSVLPELIKMRNSFDEQIKTLDARLRLTEQLLQERNVKLEQMNEKISNLVQTISQMASTPPPPVAAPAATTSLRPECSFSLEDVKRLIKQAISTYDADKTGLTDFALESSGAQVLSIRCSKTFEKFGHQYSVFGIPFWRTSTSPRSVIQQNKAPGECWPFVGAQGHLVIQLSRPIIPNNFSYEHIPLQLSRDGNLSSAPKHFEVRSLDDEEDTNGFLLGQYTFDSQGDPLQFFAVQHPNPKPTRLIELIILDNYGHPEYTCLYRFRVHGQRISL